MKVALIGASGNVGSRILAELLSRGHEVTGIVRHPEKLSPREGLTAKRSDINDEAGLAKLLAGDAATFAPALHRGLLMSKLRTI
jgi:putative NADH-flavin reductase